MSLKDKEKWNLKYQSAEHNSGREPCEWLKENSALLTEKGKALDLACGEGRNAVYLASLGYDVLGLDISEIGLIKARELAKEKNLHIDTQAADLDDFGFEENAFDLVLCFYFLDRKLFPGIRKTLKPGGLVIYETFTEDHLKYTGFKKEWVLGFNELLGEFKSFRVLKYREMDCEEKGFASIIARKKEK
ncbi:MAG: SAM-dependent methyltransferase [Nitrospinaceae bacterium]|nr:MAG: SAM-dependent methyltransferase [Nitrospinaceae bacterium]